MTNSNEDKKKYLSFGQINIEDFSDSNIEEKYSKGYVMTRIAKGTMDRTRSLRINLKEFEPSSENRRVLRKNENLTLDVRPIPIERDNYNWEIHKIGKEFYSTKFGDSTFSANKIKEILTTEHNFTNLLKFKREEVEVGYSICLVTKEIVHYCYPFYRLDIDYQNLGMGMMLKAILWAKENHKKYVYIGSLQRETDKYKLQFKGLEVWNESEQSWTQIEEK